MNKRRKMAAWAAGVAVGATLCGCTMVQADRNGCPDCENPVLIHVKYDYNLVGVRGSDIYADNVGAITVYVLDAQERVVARQSREIDVDATPSPRMDPDFVFEDLDEGDYHFLAVAAQRSFAQIGRRSERPRFVATELYEGGHAQGLTLDVDREAEADGRGYHRVDVQTAVDTLWYGMTTKPLHVTLIDAATDTISLVRDTNNLHVTLVQTDQAWDNDDAMWEVEIVDPGGAAYDWLNEPTYAETVFFHPYAQWTSDYYGDDGEDGSAGAVPLSRQARYDISFTRLLDTEGDDAPRRVPTLTVTHRATGTCVVSYPLPELLGQLRSYYVRNMPMQEFLDRAYDFQFNVYVYGTQLRYADIAIHVLGWSHRVTRQELKIPEQY